MHELRKALAAGTAPNLDDPTAVKDSTRQKGLTNLAGELIRRQQRRRTHQRNEDRFPVEQIKAVAEWRGEASDLMVVNISSNGMQIETSRPARIGETIEVALSGCDAVECVVRWIKGTRIGLEFSAETRLLTEAGVVEYVLGNISEVLTAAGETVDRRLGPERRDRSMRHGLIWLGSFTAGGETVPALLRNVSQTGALLRLDEPLDTSKGDVCELDLGKAGALSGVVMWSAGEATGIQFDEPFDVSMLTEHAAAEVETERPPSLFEAARGDAPDTTKAHRLLQRKPWDRDWGDTTGEESVDANYPGLGPPSLKELYDTLYPQGRPPVTAD
jgi:hypothetical protein